jgi:hypothetical protein
LVDVECGVVGSSIEGREYGLFCSDDILLTVLNLWESSFGEGEGDASNDVSVHFPRWLGSELVC